MEKETDKQVIKNLAIDFVKILTMVGLMGIPTKIIYDARQDKKENRQIEQSQLEDKTLNENIIKDALSELRGTDRYASTRDYQKLLNRVGIEYKLQLGESLEMASMGGDSIGLFVQSKNGGYKLQLIHRKELQEYVDSERK